MNRHPSANDKETVERVQAALEELVPAINAFKSESVQLRVVDGFVIPILLASEVQRMQLEAGSRSGALLERATYEFVLGLVAKLTNEDTRADLHLLRLWLDALKSQKAVLRVLIAAIDRRADPKSDEQQGPINCLTEQVERQMAMIIAGEASPDRKRAAQESLQKILDILRSMDPQI